jgi:hypothetical protein
MQVTSPVSSSSPCSSMTRHPMQIADARGLGPRAPGHARPASRCRSGRAVRSHRASFGAAIGPGRPDPRTVPRTPTRASAARHPTGALDRRSVRFRGSVSAAEADHALGRAAELASALAIASVFRVRYPPRCRDVQRLDGAGRRDSWTPQCGTQIRGRRRNTAFWPGFWIGDRAVVVRS